MLQVLLLLMLLLVLLLSLRLLREQLSLTVGTLPRCSLAPLADRQPAISLVSHHAGNDPAGVYVQPAGLGAVGRMPNPSCVGANNMRLVCGIQDAERGYEIARLRTTTTVHPGESLTWRYGATTNCRAEAAAVLCACPACDKLAAEGKPRRPFYKLVPNSVRRCGKCETCLCAVFA